MGRNYHWVDRLSWTDDEAKAYLADPTVSLWLLTVAGSPAGYFELKRHDDGSTEIAYFGFCRSSSAAVSASTCSRPAGARRLDFGRESRVAPHLHAR